MDKNQAFSFGRNWQEFLKSLDDERISIAETSLTEFLNLRDLRGKSFLDIGCGSGLFSKAAFNLNAERVISFDVDPFSVECCRYLHDRSGKPSHWQVQEGSVLDDDFLASLGSFDIVYSWGVLHHTGRMWDAVKNSAALVNPGGNYYIAIYNRVLASNGSTSWIHPFWLKIKTIYNSNPAIGKFVFQPLAKAAYVGIVMAKLENPVTHIKNYKSHRGMSWKTDATDWLGGYPYEFATVEEVFKFVRGNFPDLSLTNLKVTSGRGLNWFLFERVKNS
ncbi:MAG: class I SAM-dependent methyltransferase [Desulfomonile tiedjei]|uniref:Class I SAM-dependent methyltransferase n=1 Tax=Desulfomonile tiedjei TaxID=2358 RepID=A0A9D6V4E3_9BACT|nr:class I SAM-dependent methyltransferase [Desulfomonile tiedjei]